MTPSSRLTTNTVRRPDAATAVVLVITLLVAVSWLPGLFGPLGDNHEGRIYGMVSLQVSNLWDLGWSASQWGTSRAPFAAAYSHHPPGFSLWYVPAWRLPGDPTIWIRVLPYALGLSFLPASFLVLRRLRLAPMAAAIAVGLVAATPLYWVYGRIWPALGLVALLTLAVVDLREREQVTAGRLTLACGLAAFVVLTNFFAMAAAALLGLWLLARRRLDRVTVTVGATMVLSGVVSLGWVMLAPDTVEFANQVVVRTTGGGFTGAAFLTRMVRWARELLPVWTWMAVIGVGVALADRRSRAVMLGAGLLGVGWIVGFPNGSYVHDYWIASVVPALVIGLAVLADRLLEYSRIAVTWTGVALVAAAAVALGLSDVGSTYISGPQDAGRLVQAVGRPSQSRGWVTRGIAGPTWLGYAWDAPVDILRRVDDVDDVPAGDLVLVDLGHPPPWLRPDMLVQGAVVDRIRDYAVVRGDALRAAIETTAG